MRTRIFGAVGVATILMSSAASAQDTFLGAVEEFPYNFCPRGWAPAQGQLLPINENTALFSLIGTKFGGDGRTTFALPDLRPAKTQPAAPAAGSAKLYQHCGFVGWSVSLSPGEYKLKDLQQGFVSDDMSSIQLPQGWSATLYEGANLDGTSLSVSSTQSCLVESDFNDIASSVVIRGTSTPATAQPVTAYRKDEDKLITCIATVGIFPSRN